MEQPLAVVLAWVKVDYGEDKTPPKTVSPVYLACDLPVYGGVR